MIDSSQILDLVDSLDAIVWEGDASTLAFTFVSRRAEAILGYPVRQWLEEPDFWEKHIHPDDRERAVRLCREATRACRDHTFEYRFLAADGRIVWLRDVVRVCADGAGGAKKVRGVMIDISERKRAEDALSEREAALKLDEQHFRALVEHSNDLVSILDGDGTVRYASPSHEPLLGWTREELEGRGAFDMVHPDDLPGLIEAFAGGVGIPGFTATREFRYRHKDGSWRTLEGRATNMQHDPTIRGAVINSRDVTARHLAEEELRRRLESDQLIADISMTLANADPRQLDRVLPEVLGAVGRAIGAQRVFIALLAHEQGPIHVRHEWCAEGRPPMGPAMQSVLRDEYPWFMDTLQSEGWAELRLEQMPPSAVGERALMERLGVHTGRGVRMMARGRFLGLIDCGFEQTPTRALEEDLQLLRVVGEICANAIVRQREEDAKTALLELTRSLGGTLDLREMLERAQAAVAAGLPCDRVTLHHTSDDESVLELVAAYGFTAEQPHPPRISGVTPGRPLYDALRRGEVVAADSPGRQSWFPEETLVEGGVGPFVVAPLTVGGRLRGMIAAARNAGGRAFDSAEIELFQGMAQQISLAVHGAEIYRSKEAEAAVASALVRVGQELISSLDQPVLLERLSRLAAEVLGCDVSHTYLWSNEEQAYVAVASYGVSPERAEVMRLVRLPQTMVQALVQQLHSTDVVQVLAGEPQHIFPEEVVRNSRLQSAVYVALRRGKDVLGALMAARRRRAERFSADEMRIAQGIGQLASLALANTGVVEELERLSRLKSDFVATMSHELRTPLNVIMGYNDLLLDSAFGPMLPEQVDVVDRMRRSAAELLELINATLDVSRLDTGRLPVDRRHIAPAELLHEIEVEVRSLRSRPGVHLEWECEKDLPEISTDPLKLKVIVKNLVGNALKFTDHGVVRIAARAVPSGLQISVSDTGIGIAPEMQAVIFEAFRQADGSATRRHGGVGLGLYIVRRLLDLLGGSISLESEVGRGTTFRVLLPAARDHDASAS